MGQRVIVVGGGAIGSAIAYWLTRDPAFAGTVTVLERDPSYRHASSALSASSIRQQYSTTVNIEIGKLGIGFLRSLATHLAVDGEVPEIGLVEPGYLFLATEAGLPTLLANHEVQRAAGADVLILQPGDLTGGSPGSMSRGWPAGRSASPGRDGSTATG